MRLACDLATCCRASSESVAAALRGTTLYIAERMKQGLLRQRVAHAFIHLSGNLKTPVCYWITTLEQKKDHEQIKLAFDMRSRARAHCGRRKGYQSLLSTAFTHHQMNTPAQVIIPYERVASRPPNNPFCQAKFTFCPNSSGEPCQMPAFDMIMTLRSLS